MKTCALFVDENGISVGYDKESAIRCKDQEQAASVILYNNTHTVKKANIKPGTYPIPGWRFEVRTIQRDPNPDIWERVAILIKESEKEQADEESGMYEQYPNELAVREAVKNDDIAMFAGDDDLLIYEHFFHKGIEFATRKTVKEESQEEVYTKKDVIDILDHYRLEFIGPGSIPTASDTRRWFANNFTRKKDQKTIK